jgi:hypothetical protein
MKRIITMLLISKAKGACADAGIIEPSLYEVPCTLMGCSASTGCINDGLS